jgi:hypothetical protein
LTTDTFGNVVCGADQGGSGSTVGGTDTQIQFNSGGSFTGVSNFTFSSSTQKLTVTNASTTNITASYASTSNLVASNTFTLGNLTGFLKAASGVVSTSLVNLAGDVAGILAVGNGGTGWSNLAPGAVLLGNGSGAVATTTRGNLTETGSSILTITGGTNALLGAGATIQVAQASGSQSGYLASSDWTAFNGKLASSSLATSALLADLVSDHTGSGSLVFATSPTFAGIPVFSGGAVNYSVNSTTTIPNNTPGAWALATSTTGTPLISVDTTSGSETVAIGRAGAATSSVTIGGAGQPANLIFQGNSTIEEGALARRSRSAPTAT